MGNVNFERGQVWYVDFDNGFGGNIASGRPVLLVSSDIDCERNDYVEVAVMTRQDKKMIVNVRVMSGGVSGYVLCNSINSVEKSRLRDCKGKLSDSDMAKVDEGILIALGMKDARSTATAGAEVVELTVERDMYKRLYERALEKLVESAYARESRPVDVASQPEPPQKKTARVIADPVEPEPEEQPPQPKQRAVRVVTNEVDPDSVKPEPSKKKNSWTRHEPVAGAEKVNINTCVAQDLTAIGMERSAAHSITGYRNKNGAFSDVLDLLKVKRISAAMLEKFEHLLEV